MAKRKNVQEQNEITKSQIEKCAYYWRTHALPQYLQAVFQSKGVDMSTAILVEYEHDYPGTATDFGLILTEDKRFIAFDVDFYNGVASVERWKDVSQDYEIAENKRGYKKTYGFLACEVMTTMNTPDISE